MLRKVEGIILRAIKYSETSVICDAYTKELGLRTYIISGVRKKNSRISPALVQPMSMVNMVVYHNEEKDMNRIKEIKPSYIYQEIPFDVPKGAIGLFITEVAQKTVKEPESNPALFYFLTNCYKELDLTKVKFANFPIWFLVHFASYLGLSLNIHSLEEKAVFDYANGCILSEVSETNPYCFSCENTHFLAAFLELNFEASSEIRLSTIDRRSFLSDMLRYYQYHLDNFGELNSTTVLQTVFS